ncbi:MAG: hypothetical protein EXS05_17270 [Planctomycetaceae bacterium]|nr:hypothetical protein [Planctomycetaceae bacterium]
MDRALDVGSSYREWWFLSLVVLTVCLCLGGGMLFLVQHELALPTLIGGAACAVATALSATSIAARKASVRITPDGFLVQNRRGDREFTDEQVICAALSTKSNYSSGELRSTTRTFDLWVEGDAGPERLKMVNRIGLGVVDPLELLIERILGHLYDRAVTALTAEQAFEGEGWSLYGNELVATHHRRTETVRVDELAAVDVFDNDLCVWKHNQDEPALRIPMRSANAHVLLTLLRERVAAPTERSPSAGGDRPTDGRLGRVLFERKPGRWTKAFVMLLPAAAVVCLVAAVITALARQRLEPAAIGAVLSFMLLLMTMIPLSLCAHLRCHEHGVCMRGLWRERRLKYADVDSFAYNAVPQYVKGVYSGTTFTLTFATHVDGKPSTLTYAKTLRNADEELDHLRDHVSRVIAARMSVEFSRGKAVAWTDGLKFLAEGLEHRASGFLGRKPPVVLRYDQITGVDASHRAFQLWIGGQKKPVVKESVSQPNFFPGYLFLTRLMAMRLSSRPVEVS